MAMEQNKIKLHLKIAVGEPSIKDVRTKRHGYMEQNKIKLLSTTKIKLLSKITVGGRP